MCNVINVDKNPAYPKAIGKLKGKGTLPQGCELRPIKYLNNLIEQDHRFIKRRVNPMMGYERSKLVVGNSGTDHSGIGSDATAKEGSGTGYK